jgi:SNF2 family DNA or RNA helicase
MAKMKRAKRWGNAPKPKRKRRAAPKKRKTETKRAAPVGPPPDLRPFQREGVDYLAEHNWRVLLADAPGCGKTPQVLVAIRENARALCPALAVVPASVLRNWRREAERWVPGIRVQTLATQSDPLRRGHHLTITTWDVAAARKDSLLAYGFRLLVADEAHYAKNPDTARSMAIREIAGRCPHVLLLTGTPMLNDVDELRVLEGMFGTETPPMLRRLLEDVAPDIPAKRRVYLHAEIPAGIRGEYEQVVAEFGEWLDDYLPTLLGDAAAAGDAAERALAAEPLAKLAYLRRILGRGKVPAAAAWVQNMRKRGEPCVVFGHYNDVMDLLGQSLSKLAIPYVRLDGSTSTEARQAAVEAFQGGEVDVFLASSAAREGITLTRAAHMLRFERDYVPAYEEQSEDRIRRIGQTRTTTIWYLHAENSIDQRISEIVDRKRALVAQTIGAADLEHVELDEIIDVWRRIPQLREGVPLVADNPTAAIDVPDLPPSAVVQSVLLDPARWPLDGLQRVLRRRGYRQRSIERLPGGGVRLHCRSLGAFRDGRVRQIAVAPGLAVLVGQRASTGAARMRATRRTQRTRRLRIRRTRR